MPLREPSEVKAQLLTAKEAADLLNVKRNKVVEWIREDRVPFVELPPIGSGNYRLPLQGLLGALSDIYDLAGAADQIWPET